MALRNDVHFSEERFELLIEVRPTKYHQEQLFKCLAVRLNQDITFKHHISDIMNKAKQIAGWLLRTFKSRDQELIATLWRVLDYFSQR